ncbi:HTH-type dhaKLM operon transcriptional activator dhaS [Slackia heliotrinireducens]|uniref:Transcriptional regulator n=1 Tax=Slackia heliotrinireducens (strain ATCC 29202 / DSM 20476 / NCTC 11029 / RHS 1) TaxID=471855 RepID=C7N277_SLAHD|nr:TetR/AcrR family transcriptional regulator [Slackia heliotrinireducens]ACV21383.1 transcriptional regulator [Slackia heliotrinireducens DSM 20476]VEG98817.1 HTH-type dhaKLM operon transcriptional activator dhaS [Slackia heliotrinireducens]
MNTEKFIVDAFEDLMRDHPFDCITVDMILNLSGVSRSTFYRHFSSKYELMGAFYRSEIDKLTTDRDMSWRIALRETTEFVKKNYSFFNKAVRIDGEESFMSFLYGYSYDFYSQGYLLAHETTIIPADIQVALEFLCSGHIFALQKWIERGCDIPTRDMGDYLYELIPERIRETLM